MTFSGFYRRLFCLAMGVWLWTGPSFIFAQARKPPLPHNTFTSVVDGKIRTDLEMVQVEDIPCLSLRTVQRLFGGRQAWQRVSRQVTYEVYGHRALFHLDTSTATIQGKMIELETPVRWWTGNVFVPLSLVLTPEFQALTETKTHWDAHARSLLVEPVPSVSSPRFYTYADHSRLVFELGRRVNYRGMGQRGKNFYVRFFGGRSLGNERIEVKDGLIESVHLKAHSRSSDLIVALSPQAGSPRVRLEEGPRRLVVDVFPGGTLPVNDKTLLPATPDDFVDPLNEPDLSYEEDVQDYLPNAPPSAVLANSPIKTIVIDPGHGGKDAGAVGPHGTLEKDINLEVAKALARVLKREGRFRVILTRVDDTFIPLQKRTDIANNKNADFFVSIHSNAALSRKSNGFEIYFLSEKATDDAAAAVARRENAVVELEGITGKAKLKLQELLWSLAKTETMNESSEAAALMVHQVDKRIGIPNRGVKQAGFFVLKGANMPAVLVECGFISNRREEGLLRSRRFQNRLADGLYAGILDYEKRKRSARAPRTAAGGN